MIVQESFEKYRKALIGDLNKIDSYSQLEKGVFLGSIFANRVWLEFDDKQEDELIELVFKTFSAKNFTWLGKRKKESLLE